MADSWNNLPNGYHIGFVSAHFKQNRALWRIILLRMMVSNEFTGRYSVYSALNDANQKIACNTEKQTVWDTIRLNEGLDIISNTLLALVAYDECGYLLFAELEEVEILASLGQPAAVLLLPACTVINSCNVS